MIFTLKSAAEHFNGRQYPLRLSVDETTALKNAGLAIVHGYSDDLVEIEGAIRDEASAIEGTTVFVGSSAFLPINQDGTLTDDVATIEDAKALVAEYSMAIKINAEWSIEPYSWLISVDPAVAIPHATFDVMEDDEKFCRAIVIQVPQAAPSSKEGDR